MEDHPANQGNANQGNANQIPAAEVVPEQLTPPVTVPPIVIQQPGGNRLLRFVATIGWTGFFIAGLMLISQYVLLGEYFDTTGGIQEKYHSLEKFAGNKVAIITVKGMIVSGEGYVKRQIERVRQDDSVKAVVVRVDSPGGTVTGADYIFHHLTKLRDEREIPLVVSMGSMATSGGYYVAMAVGDQPKSIYAEPTTTTGSIGVMIPHYDISGLLARFDVKDDTIATHPRKEMLSMTKPMTDDHRQLLEAYLNEAFERFKSIVKKGRPAFRENEAKLDELATGEVFTANQALQHGLIDEIGFEEDAIDRVIELAGLDKDNTQVVRYEAPFSLFGLSAASSGARSSQLEQLLEMGTPRAYYLWTQLPPLLRLPQ